MTLGGRRVPVSRPRARSADGSEEVALATYAHFADRDALTAGVLCVLDGAKALRKAVRDVLGTTTPVQRCIRHYADLRVMPTHVRRACSGRGSARFCRHNQSASRNARMRSVGW